jgi:polar amino acid transport system substrate-binding protein
MGAGLRGIDVFKTTLVFCILCTLWLLIFWPGVAAAEVLRVCADPDNLPFTNDNPAEPGLYVELAEMIAVRLGVSTEYTWWRSYFGKRAVRNTLLSDQCDAYFVLPYDKGFMGKSVALTQPFLVVGYALVVPISLALERLDDLRGKTVGVQFATPPQILLAERTDMQTVTFRSVEEVMEALAKRQVETAFVWGPTAGYYNKKHLRETFQVVPVAGPGLQWQVAIGVKRGHEALTTRLERELESLIPAITRLAEKYGFPLDPPRDLGQLTKERLGASQVSTVSQSRQTNPFNSDSVLIATGRSLFNQYCSHCHSPDAMNPEPRTDLRRLKLRYGEKADEIFYATVTQGRPNAGMPSWREVLSDEVIWKVKTFLNSVQKEP